MIQAMIVWGYGGHDATGDNSVRLYDPLANAWTYAWPNNHGASGSKARNNHVSFLVPTLGLKGEFWMLPGAGGYDVGRFDLATRTWTVYPNWNPSTQHHDFETYCEGFGQWAQVENAACGWSESLNMGVCFGGDTAGTATQTIRVFYPQSGAKPYRYAMNNWPAPAPSARGVLQGSGVMVGTNFYVIGGRLFSGQIVRELWRCALPSLAWTRLADAPVWQANTPMTYDSVLHALVGLGPTWVIVYDLTTNTWRQVAIPSGEYGRSTAVGAYCPPINAHLFTGGTSVHLNGVPVTTPGIARTITQIRFSASTVLPVFSTITPRVA